MKNCELLKHFHENNRDVIEYINTISTKLSQKESYSDCDMGSMHSGHGSRFIVKNGYASMEFTGNNFRFQYYSIFDIDNEYNSFYSADTAAEVLFGTTECPGVFKISDNKTFRFMHYPIREDQFFQAMTLFDISTESLYQYFNDLEVPHICNLRVTVLQNEGFEEFKNMMNDVGLMKILKNNIFLVSSAYKMMNGIK